MDPAIRSATAALVGSLVGGVSTFAAYWLTQRLHPGWNLITAMADDRKNYNAISIT